MSYISRRQGDFNKVISVCFPYRIKHFFQKAVSPVSQRCSIGCLRVVWTLLLRNSFPRPKHHQHDRQTNGRRRNHGKYRTTKAARNEKTRRHCAKLTYEGSVTYLCSVTNYRKAGKERRKEVKWLRGGGSKYLSYRYV